MVQKAPLTLYLSGIDVTMKFILGEAYSAPVGAAGPALRTRSDITIAAMPPTI
jgi:hypothetical protein